MIHNGNHFLDLAFFSVNNFNNIKNPIIQVTTPKSIEKVLKIAIEIEDAKIL